MVRPRQWLSRKDADELDHRRLAAVEALGCIGPEARAALPVLKEASVEKDWSDKGKVYIASREAAAAAGLSKDWIALRSPLNDVATEAIKKITGK